MRTVTRAQIKKDIPSGPIRPLTKSTTRPTTQAQAGFSTPKKVKPTPVRVTTNKPKADASSLGSPLRRSKHFKKASSTYRRTDTGGGFTFSRTGRISIIIQGTTGRSLSPGKHVGERFMNPKILCIATERFVFKIIR